MRSQAQVGAEILAKELHSLHLGVTKLVTTSIPGAVVVLTACSGDRHIRSTPALGFGARALATEHFCAVHGVDTNWRFDAATISPTLELTWWELPNPSTGPAFWSTAAYIEAGRLSRAHSPSLGPDVLNIATRKLESLASISVTWPIFPLRISDLNCALMIFGESAIERAMGTLASWVEAHLPYSWRVSLVEPRALSAVATMYEHDVAEALLLKALEGLPTLELLGGVGTHNRAR